MTVREQARIQGFRDGHKFYGSDSAQYRQVGNAVPPPLGRALGGQIRAVLETERTEDNYESQSSYIRESQGTEKRKTRIPWKS